MENQEPTNRELQVSINTLQETINTVLETVNTFANHVEGEFASVKQEINGIKQEIGGLKQDIGIIKATMVTKDYLDDKLAIRKADLIIIDRKQEEKINSMASKLADKKVFTRQEAEEIVHISPFPMPPVISR